MNKAYLNIERYILLATILLLMLFNSCQSKTFDVEKLNSKTQFDQIFWNSEITDVMVADIFTPPVCSRIYAYPHIAAYEVIAANSEEYKSLSSVLNGLEMGPPASQDVYLPVSAMIAFAKTAKPLLYAQEKVDTAIYDYIEGFKELDIPMSILENSIEYGNEFAKHISNWIKSDGYLERTALSQHMLSDDPNAWKPTPPDYMPAIEPHWNTMRPFVMDSAQQFKPKPPTKFSESTSSLFYKEAKDVMDKVNALNKEEFAIAKFWDCNPNISYTKGHLMFYDQKISPGGHWMSITGIVSRNMKLSFEQISLLYAMSSITMADAFISCWDEKYRSDLIRPETYINKYIDKDWKPVLQTPAFPEYTSGHSVVSSSASVILAEALGDSVSFTDDTEVKYGLPMREFNSFYNASNEAAISRLYGGIHYMPAIENGVDQGKRIGQFMVEKFKDYLIYFE